MERSDETTARRRPDNLDRNLYLGKGSNGERVSTFAATLQPGQLSRSRFVKAQEQEKRQQQPPGAINDTRLDMEIEIARVL